MKTTGIAAPLAAALIALGAGPAAASPVIIRYICFDRDAKLTQPDDRGVIRGTHRNDVIVTSAPKVVVIGRGGHDRVCAFGRDVYVAGGRGNDLISTGRGADLIYGGRGRDVLIGGGRNDRLVGGFGSSDTLVGRAGDDRLEGGDEAGDHLFGGRGADRLVGGSGTNDDDFLVGGEGTDSIDGGGGSDTASFAFSEEGVEIDLATGTSSTDEMAGIENLDGSLFDDVLIGNAGDNRLRGDDGTDVLSGGVGDDLLDGGAGADSVDGGEGLDLLSFFSSPNGVAVDLEVGSSGPEPPDVFEGFENLLGSAYDDQLAGDEGPNSIDGSRGDDALFGRDGDDSLHSGSSGDGGPGADTCWDSSGVIENCEQELHGDPAAFSTILSPTEASTIEVAQFREIYGSASAGAFGPEPKRVQIALRRLSGSGCYWWNQRRATMQRRHCDRPLWVDTAFDDGQGTWSRRVPDPVQLLNPGRYQVRSRIRQPGFTERGHSAAYNLVEFRLR
jgi:hypothetical protein